MKFVMIFGMAAVSMAADKHPKPAPAPIDPAQKIRVFVGESETFLASSFGTASANSKSASAVQSSSAGFEKMTVLVMKELSEKCPTVIVVNNPDKADYFLRLDRNGVFVRTNAMAVFNHSGEMVFAGSSVRLGKEVARFCAGLPRTPPPAPGQAPKNP
jgi:hypothetical protein